MSFRVSLKLICLFATALYIPVASSAPKGQGERKDVVYRAEAFSVTEGGGFLTKTWKELGSREAAQIITAACAAYGYDCSNEAEAIRRVAQESHNRFNRGKYRGTFRVRQRGEEWRGGFSAPPGYSICTLYTPLRRASITGGSTFNATISNTQKGSGVSVYAVIPKNRSTRQWATFNMVAMYVPIDDYSTYSCWPHRTAAVRCKGPRTCRSKKATPN